MRGKRNEPAFTRHTLEKIAGLRGVDAEELAHQLWQNSLDALDIKA
jgi:TatD DNase family protein